jgi:TonB family protein
MNGWHYLLLVNIYLILFHGFYILLLRKETFFQLNRIYLVAAALLSFIIPLIQSDWVKSLFITQRVQNTLYSSPVMFYRFNPIQNTHITIGQLGVAVYVAGIIFLAARFIWQIITLRRVINQPQPTVAYSFFKKIKLGNNVTNQDVIAAHELAHAGQWHSVDILLIELVMIINWFNPVVYLYRLAIKHIHEFIADRQALRSGTNKAEYALLLLNQTFNMPAHRLVNPFFNHSLLKQRIMMLHKSRSNRVALIKYGLSAPLFILMLILSSATISNSRTVRLFNEKAGEVFLIPATAAPGEINAISGFPVTSAKKNINHISGPRLNVPKAVWLSVSDTIPQKDDKIFSAVEQVPEFPGGIKAFGEYLAKNIKYPEQARKNNVQGRVIIKFVVEQDGTLTNIGVARSVENDIDQEALRVIEQSPKWTPGLQNGHLVRVVYSVPISFTLDDGRPVNAVENKSGAVIENKTNSNTTNSASINAVVKPDTGNTPVLRSNGLSVSPRYIVDGKEVANLNKINANDIESISVTKDAAAIAGTKGASPVVIVITKKNSLKLKP